MLIVNQMFITLSRMAVNFKHLRIKSKKAIYM